MSRCFFPVLFILLFGALAQGQSHSSLDSILFVRHKQSVLTKDISQQPMGVVVAQLAKSFIGSPYRSHTLETGNEESLVINLREFDCTTFVEEMLALARTLKHGGDYSDFGKNLGEIRYRNGKMAGYCSRLHYFSEWSLDNVRKGLVKNITESLGGVPYELKLNFMSAHPSAYEKLAHNNERIDSIRIIERKISGQEFHFIPKTEISRIEKQLQDGDIVGFTTMVSGLDIGHVAMIVTGPDGRKYLLHAPHEGSSVMISKQSLSEYCNSIKKHSGVIILRPVE